MQNELLKQKLEMGTNNKSNNTGLIVIIVILLIIIVGGIVFFINNNNSSVDEDDYDYEEYTETSKEKTCVKWKNTYNFSYCEYNFTNGCVETGRECVKWE